MQPKRWALDARAMLLVVTVLVFAAGCSGGTDNSSSGATSSSRPAYPDSTWAQAGPGQSTVDPAKLDAIQQYLDDQQSDCMAVVQDGRLVRDVYWQGSDATTDHEIFSATKSITSMVVGIAQDDGKLNIDEPASKYITEWQGTPSQDVTIRDLLSNDSGRFWSLDSDYNQLIRAPDKTAYAVGLTQQSPPGTTWAYNNAAIQTLDAVIKRATGEDTAEFARTRLFEPIGMSSKMSHDAAGNTLTFMGVQASCLDLARFGVLLLQQGRWEDRQIVSAQWVKDATTTSTPLNAAYGYLIWLNEPGVVKGAVGGETQGPIWPGAPADAYAALGLGGQTVLVLPDDGLVVTRIGPAQGGTGQQDQVAGKVAAILAGS